MTDAYTAEQRRIIAAALDTGAAPVCPVCGQALSRQPVEAVPGVSYVRHRVWVICPGCRRTASVDVRAGG